jgi:hypothetical protein
MKSQRTFALVLSICGFGCELERPLGDIENGAGRGGDSGGASGSGSTTGGAPNGGSNHGGAANGGAANGGTSSGGTPQGGASPNGGSAGGGGCFSPDDNPELSLEPDSQGCACSEGTDQCLAIPEGGGLHLVGMVCREGRWSVVEDGPCEPGPSLSWCMIENRVFKDGGPVPAEFLCRFCWFCGAGHGACPLIDCAPPPCPAGTAQGSRCRSCGLLPGGCDITEHGCFAPCDEGETCDWGRCSDGVCSVGPCI